MKSFATVIKKIRNALYLQQSEMAEVLQISKASICKYEQGKTIPRLKVARKIKALADKNNIKVSMDDLIRIS
jgi:DNA-binding XRE family transcriptional regulator